MRLVRALAHLWPVFNEISLVSGAGIAASDELTYGKPESVGMMSGTFREMAKNLTSYTQPANYGSFTFNEVHPIEPGGTIMVARHGTIVSAFGFGNRSIYANSTGALLETNKHEIAIIDSIYDMASLTKLFASVSALQLVDAGRIRLNCTVKEYIPEFESNGKGNVTILMLLTHTSGFDSGPQPPLFSDVYSTYEERVGAIIRQGLRSPPGSTYLYSDLNMMALMIVLENVTGRKLDDLITDITRPLGMNSTFFNRGNVEGDANPFYSRTAPQEFQLEVSGLTVPARPQPVRGTVHDENAWALDGVSGHAGLFSTIEDTAVFCQMILNGGTYGGHRIISPYAVDLIFTNFNTYLGEIAYARGIGFQLNQYSTAGPLNTSSVASHTGFTGTSIVIDRGRDLFYLHFANRVHPTREWSSNNIVRQALGYWVGTSLGLELPFPSLG